MSATKIFFSNIFANLIASPIRFALNLILASCLLPRDYGEMVIPLAIVMISRVLVDSGLNSSLIQKSTLKANHSSTVFFTNLLVSILLCLLFCALSFPLQLFFKIRYLAILICVASLAMVIRSLAMVNEARLQIKGKYGQLVFVEFISYVVGYAVAIYMAKNHYGVFSLLALVIVSAICYTPGLFYFERFVPKLHFVSKKLFYLHWRMGKHLLFQGLLETFSDKIDEIVLGKFTGISSLGLYSKGREYSNTLGILGSKFFSRPWFSVMSKHSTNKGYFIHKYQFAYLLLIIAGTVMITGDFYFGRFFIHSILGSQWMGLVKLFHFFIISTALYYLVTFNKYTILALGKPEINLKAETYYAGFRLMILCVIFLAFNKNIYLIYLLIGLDITARMGLLMLQSHFLNATLREKTNVFVILFAFLMLGLGIISIFSIRIPVIFGILFLCFICLTLYWLFKKHKKGLSYKYAEYN